MGIFSLVWWQPLILTLELMAVTVVLSGIIGLTGAWSASSIEGAGRSGKLIARLFFAAMVAALAMPLILHAAAWEATAGKFGWLPLTQTGSRSSTIGAFGAFGGLLAAGWIHGLVGGALVAIATWHGVRGVPSSIISQSEIDMSPLSAWWRVRLPIALPWLITSLIGAATLAATEMTVVDLYGFRTVADEFYLYHATEATLPVILFVCFLPLALASIGLLTVAVWRRRWIAVTSQQGHGESENIHRSERLPAGLHRLACVLAVAIASIVIVVPISGLMIKAGHRVTVEDGKRSTSWSPEQFVDTLGWAPVTFASEYQWTVVIAVSTGIVAVLLAWIVAAYGRTHRRAAARLDLISLLMVLIPGPIVGLTVVRFFQLDFPGFKVAYQQTLLPTIIALLFRAGPVAYWVLRAGYRSIDDRVFAAAQLDQSWLRRLWSVDRPLLGRSLVAASLASAIIASGDVPALLPVIPPGVSTAGTRLFELLHNGARYQEAALALWYVGAVVTVVLVWLKSTTSGRGKLS